jgi:transposase
MPTISMDLRTRIFQARQEGETTCEVAERFAVSPAFVRRLIQRHRETGTLDPKSGPRGAKPRLAPHAERLRELVAERPDLTPAELRDRLGVAVTPLTVWRMLRRLGLTFKKNPSAPPSRRVPTSPPPAEPGPGSSPRRRPNA